VQKQIKMAISFKLPKIDADSALFLDTPDPADIVLASGVLTVKDEAGNDALIVRAGDFLDFEYKAYAAGTANIVDVDLSSVTMVNNGTYSLTVSAPYAVNFFGGGQETGAVYTARTYLVSADGTATIAEVVDSFVARINGDLNAYFSAAAVGGTTVRITADDAGFGPLTIQAPAGSAVSDNVAWVEPVGTLSEVQAYFPGSTLGSASYSRFVLRHRKAIRTNIVNGLQVIKPAKAIIYIDSLEAATISSLTGILDGSSTAADYLGCPAV
jgi:hypothetical protein